MVQKEGLEPSRDFSHMPLKHACLPIPALLHGQKKACNKNYKFLWRILEDSNPRPSGP